MLNNNDGTISVESGVLNFVTLPKYLNDGIYNVADGTSLKWNSQIVLSGTLTGILDGEVLWNKEVNVPSGTTANFDFTGTTGVNWSKGSLNGGGTLVNKSEITMLTSESKHIHNYTNLNNEGVINYESTGVLYVNNGSINNKSTGVIDLISDGDFLSYTGGSSYVLNNLGLLKKSAGTGTTAIGSLSTNSGTIDVQIGTLEFAGSLGFNNTVDGKIMGIATLDLPVAAAFTNDGIFAPGGSPGTLTVLGDYKSSSTSKLQIELYGYSQGTEYDLLAIQGNATMDGDIPILLDFEANIGDEFVIVTANSISNCNLPATVTARYDNRNYIFDVICNSDNVTLKVTDIVLGAEENSLSNLSMYPNPTNGDFTIDLGKEYADVTLQIYNILGQLISSETYASAKIIEKEITSAAGVYFVRVNTANDGSNTLRIIKQ